MNLRKHEPFLFAHPDDHKQMPQILAIGSNFGILAFLNLEEPA